MLLAPELPHGSPAVLRVLERAWRFGLFLHARELCLEHLFCALLDDEQNAACQALIGAFADPRSLAEEARATADGILVVGSVCALPFSHLGARALFEAREQAALAGDAEIGPARVAWAAFRHSPAELRARLSAVGCSEDALLSALPTPGEPWEWDSEDSVFRRFDAPAKKLLANAARAAHLACEVSISPQRLLLAALEAEPALCPPEAQGGPTIARLASGLTADPSQAPERTLGLDAELLEFLGRLGGQADTLDMLLGFFEPPGSVIAQLLARHRLHPEALRAGREQFEDPPGA